ncbi:hypothetical protein [Microbacterium xylanilyticum]
MMQLREEVTLAVLDYSLGGTPYPIPEPVLVEYLEQAAPGAPVTRDALDRAVDVYIGEFDTVADAARAITAQSLPRDVRHLIAGWPFTYLDWDAASHALTGELDGSDGGRVLRIGRHYFARD